MCIIKYIAPKKLKANSLDRGLLNVFLNILNANAFLVKCDSLALRKADTGNLRAPHPSHSLVLPFKHPQTEPSPQRANNPVLGLGGIRIRILAKGKEYRRHFRTFAYSHPYRISWGPLLKVWPIIIWRACYQLLCIRMALWNVNIRSCKVTPWPNPFGTCEGSRSNFNYLIQIQNIKISESSISYIIFALLILL